MKFLCSCRTWTGSNLLGSVLYWLHWTNIVKASYIMLSLPCYQIAVNRLTWSMDSNQSNSPLLRKATVVEIWPFSSARRKVVNTKTLFQMCQQYSFPIPRAQEGLSVWISRLDSFSRRVRENALTLVTIEAWANGVRARHLQNREIHRKDRVDQIV